MSNLNSCRMCLKFFTAMSVLMLAAMLGLVTWSALLQHRPAIIEDPLSSYDYIVVGGGSAGCVLASQMSADPGNSVLLIEAGQEFNWFTLIPLMAPLLQGSSYDWQYVTQPQSHSSYGLRNQVSIWPRGRGLGGSGQINYLQHFSGSNEDFDRWENGGAVGWGSRDIIPYMSRALGREYSDNTTCLLNYVCLMTEFGRDQCRRNDAKIRLRRHSNSALGDAFVAAGKELGMAFSLAESTIYRGLRWNSVDGYLHPVLHRSNLHVLLGSHVNKILWNKTQNQAIGIELSINSKKPQKIRCLKEVILSAGAINTPQILQRSGVGPKSLLHDLQIPLVSDLPVGCNLHDHMNMPLYVSVDFPVSITLNKLLRPGQLWDYMINAKGDLTSSGIVGTGTGPEHTGLILFGMGSADERLLGDLANFKPQTFQALFPFSSNWDQEGFIVLASCLQPRSRGRIVLATSDSSSPPIIDPQYLTEHFDITCMINAVKLAIQSISTSPFKRLGAKLHLPNFKECSYLEASTSNLNYLECIIRTAAITGYHPGGTCKMGSIHDTSTVVDSSLRVHGIKNLRVMDASVLPTPVSGHPNSVLVAMADRASQIILGLL